MSVVVPRPWTPRVSFPRLSQPCSCLVPALSSLGTPPFPQHLQCGVHWELRLALGSSQHIPRHIYSCSLEGGTDTELPPVSFLRDPKISRGTQWGAQSSLQVGEANEVSEITQVPPADPTPALGEPNTDWTPDPPLKVIFVPAKKHF